MPLDKNALRACHGWVASQRDAMLALLRELVELESPSLEREAAERCAARLEKAFSELGGKISRPPAGRFARHLQVDFGAENSSPPVLLLGHFDTVYASGTLASMPWKVDKGRAYGPGVYDMKGGIVHMAFAISALKQAHGGRLPRPVRVLLVSDEEVGSESSRPLTEQLARDSCAALVCEPSQGREGALKTSRKGVGDYTIRVTGRAAHAGVDFEKGASAINELARQIVSVAAFSDRKQGITVNPGVVQGGTRGNVVAAHAEVEVDVRIQHARQAARIEKKFLNLKPRDRRCTIEVTGGINRPPMERTAATVRLFALAKQAGRELGFAVKEKSTGGGSDGNFTSALGVPTLDGLGAVGEGAHAAHECIVLDEMPLRTALLAGIIARL